MNNEWLKNLKIGDRVLIESGSFSRSYQFKNIIKITPTQIIVGNDEYKERFRRMDGRRIGDSGYTRGCLVEQTPKLMSEIEIIKLQYKAKVLRDTIAIPDDKETLIKFIEALEALQPFVREKK